MTPMRAPCDKTRRQLDALIDGRLSAGQASGVLAHLRECPDCARERDARLAVRTALRNLPVPPGDEARHRVLDRFHASSRAVRRPFWSPARLSLGIAGALAVLTLLVYIGQPPDAEWSADLPVSEAASFPSPAELDAMSRLHAAGSLELSDTGRELQNDALADATARLEEVDDSSR